MFAGILAVALRKESVDRNGRSWRKQSIHHKVALRKESVDRNKGTFVNCNSNFTVALRKESVDRNMRFLVSLILPSSSLSARRAWIEISTQCRL